MHTNRRNAKSENSPHDDGRSPNPRFELILTFVATFARAVSAFVAVLNYFFPTGGR